MALERVQLCTGSDIASKDICLEPPRKHCEGLIAHMGASRDRKDVIELFQSSLLGLGDPQEDHDQSSDIQASIEAEGT